MQSDCMGNPKFVNWVKAGTALHYLKEGIVNVSNTHAQGLHAQVHALVAAITTNTCNTCKSKDIVKTKQRSFHRNAKWHVSCASNVCNQWVDAILSFDARPPHASVFWENADPRLWPTAYWEVAKVFMPRGCSNQSGAAESDCIGLLGLFLNCKYYHSLVSNLRVLNDIKELRNQLVHGGRLEVENSDLRLWTQHMLDLLEDPTHLAGLPECQEAARKIRELRDNPLDITLGVDLEKQALRQLTDGLSSDIQGLQSDMLRSNREIEELQNSAVDTELTQDQLKDNINELSIQIKKCLETVDWCKENIKDSNEFVKMTTTLYTLQMQCRQDYRQLSQDLVAVKTDLENVKRQVESQATDIATFKGQTDASQDVEIEAKHDRCQRTRDALIKLYRESCSYAPIYPLTPEITTKLPKLYVKPCMRVCSGVLGASRSTAPANFTDIFLPGINSCRNIFIVGESGVGKSALCDYMVHVWCNAQLGRGINYEDEDVMKVFPFLFYISLRHALPNQTIEDMIVDQLIEVSIDEVLSDECLVVLDGLDEWRAGDTSQSGPRFRNKGLPRFRTKRSCTVVFTSRPWKLECLRLSDREVDREILIVGLDLVSTKQLARNLATELNKTCESKKDEKLFMEEIESRGLDHFMKTPIILKQMFCLWFDCVPLGASQCEIYTGLVERQLQLAQHKKEIRMNLPVQSAPYDGLHLPDVFQSGNYPFCQKYQTLLLSLGKMAFHTLINKDRESALVFDHNVPSMHGMSERDVQLCLQIGLLSQQQLYGKIVERKKSMNFVHKSYHEYFAALYLASHSERISLVKEVCSTHQMLREIEDVPLFLCMLNPDLCRELVSHLRRVVSKDSGLAEYRRSEGHSQPSSCRILENIQIAILNLTTELEHSGHQDRYSLPINDLIIDSENVDFIESKLATLDTEELESVTISKRKEVEENTNSKYDSLLKTVSKSRKLRKMCLEVINAGDDVKSYLNGVVVTEIITQSESSLTSLQLVGIDFTTLSRVSGLSRAIWSDPFALMLKQLSLLSLDLKFIELRADQLKSLGTFLRRTSDLRELHLRHIPIHEEVSRFSIDLRTHKRLEYLSLQDLHAESVNIDAASLKVCIIEKLFKAGCSKSILGCLQSAQTLEQLECGPVIQAEDIDALVEILPQIENVKSVSIREVDFEGRKVALSPRMKNLKRFRLFRVKIGDMVLKTLLDKLPPQPLKVDIDLVELQQHADVSLGASGEDTQTVVKPHIPKYVRESGRYFVDKLFKYGEGNKWRMLFDKRETEDISETYV